MNSRARRLGSVSVLETISFVGLLWAMFTENEVAVSAVGAIHGGLFLVYALLLWIDRRDLGWSAGFAIACIVTGPLGALIVMERIRRDRASDRMAPSHPGA